MKITMACADYECQVCLNPKCEHHCHDKEQVKVLDLRNRPDFKIGSRVQPRPNEFVG